MNEHILFFSFFNLEFPFTLALVALVGRGISLLNETFVSSEPYHSLSSVSSESIISTV